MTEPSALELAVRQIEQEQERELARQRQRQQQRRQQRFQERRTRTEPLPFSPLPLSGNEPVTEATTFLDDDLDCLYECTRRWNEDNLSPITSHHLRGTPANPSPIQHNALRDQDYGLGSDQLRAQAQATAQVDSALTPLSSLLRPRRETKVCDHCERMFGFWHRSRVCHGCGAQVCRSCRRRHRFSLICQSQVTLCKLCDQISNWEALLMCGMLPSLGHSSGKTSSMSYDREGMRVVYDAWLKRPAPRHLFCPRQAKVRNEFMVYKRVAQLMNRQVWNSYVSHIAMNMNNITNCFISLLQEDEQLIVCQFGKNTPYLVFPRAISICEYTVWSESGVLIPHVSKDAAFAHNPMLKLLEAEFYFGVPIYCDAFAIGSLAVVDSSPHDMVRAEDIQLLRVTSDAIGKRLTRLITKRTSFNKRK